MVLNNIFNAFSVEESRAGSRLKCFQDGSVCERLARDPERVEVMFARYLCHLAVRTFREHASHTCVYDVP